MSKRGLKNQRIGRDMRHDDEKLGEVAWNHYFTAPFQKPEAPSVATTALVAIFVFLGCLIYGLVMLLVLSDLNLAPSALNAFILAVVAGTFFLVPEMWTNERSLRNHVLIGLPWSMVITSDYGLVTALGYTIIQFGGYAAAGAFAKALGVTTNVLAGAVTPTSTTSFWMSAFSGSIVLFAYVYNQKFEQHRETEGANHARAVKSAAMLIFGFTLALFGAGAGALRFLDGGLYFANYVAAGVFDFNWALYVFGMPFICAAFSTVLYLIVYVMLWLSGNAGAMVYRAFPTFPGAERNVVDQGAYTVVDNNAQVSSRLNARQRQTNGPIDATY